MRNLNNRTEKLCVLVELMTVFSIFACQKNSSKVNINPVIIYQIKLKFVLVYYLKVV
jgi:hypothetical protein